MVLRTADHLSRDAEVSARSLKASTVDEAGVTIATPTQGQRVLRDGMRAGCNNKWF